MKLETTVGRQEGNFILAPDLAITKSGEVMTSSNYLLASEEAVAKIEHPLSDFAIHDLFSEMKAHLSKEQLCKCILVAGMYNCMCFQFQNHYLST